MIYRAGGPFTYCSLMPAFLASSSFAAAAAAATPSSAPAAAFFAPVPALLSLEELPGFEDLLGRPELALDLELLLELLVVPRPVGVWPRLHWKQRIGLLLERDFLVGVPIAGLRVLTSGDECVCVGFCGCEIFDS